MSEIETPTGGRIYTVDGVMVDGSTSFVDSVRGISSSGLIANHAWASIGTLYPHEWRGQSRRNKVTLVNLGRRDVGSVRVSRVIADTNEWAQRHMLSPADPRLCFALPIVPDLIQGIGIDAKTMTTIVSPVPGELHDRVYICYVWFISGSYGPGHCLLDQAYWRGGNIWMAYQNG